MRLWIVLFLTSITLVLSGCGGRPSQSGMRVLRRSSDQSTGEPVGDAHSGTDSSSASSAAPANSSKASTTKQQKPNEVPKLPDGRPDPAFSTADSQMKPRKEEKDEDLSEAGRIKKTEQNLGDIGTALRRIYDTQGALPMQALRPPNRPKAERGLLSWRVFLLPTLGYGDLYRQFKLDEPWDSEHNIKLLEKIPPVFQPPGVKGTNTNYLAVVGNGTAFPSRAKRVTYRDLNKKPGQVIAIVEADMAQAVPWTKPLDWKWNKDLFGLGSLRGSNRFFCVWADGSVSQCDIRRMGRATSEAFEVEKSYPIVKSDFSFKIAVELETGEIADTRPTSSGVASSSGPADATETNTPDTKDGRVTIGDIKFDPKTGKSTFVSGNAKRHALPDEDDVERITSELRQLFAEEWKDAESKDERAEIGKKLLKKSETITEEPAALYTVLKICIDIATQNEDLETAMEACTRMAKNFKMDESKLKVRSVKDYLNKLDDKSNESKVAEHIEPLIDHLFDKERYAESLEINQLLMGQLKKKSITRNRNGTRKGVRQRKDEPTSRMTKLTKRHKKLKAYDRAHRRAKAAIESDSENTESKNLAVGVYLSFYLSNWEDGLAILGNSGESKIAKIARFDNREPSRVLEQYQLAESWWDYSDTTVDEIVKQSARERASFWYTRCANGLPAGLRKLKAKQRLEQFADDLKKR